MSSFSFTAEVWEHEGPAAWHFVSLPEDLADEIEATFGHRAAEHYRSLSDQQGLAGVLTMETVLPNALYEGITVVGSGTLPEAIEAAERGLAIAREIGWRSGEAVTLAMIGEGRAAAGETGAGLALLQEGRALAEALGHAEWTVQAAWGMGNAYADLDALPEARATLDHALRIADTMHSRFWSTMVAGGLASVLLRELNEAGATAVLAERLSPSTPMRTSNTSISRPM